MKTDAIEKLHRSAISELNKTCEFKFNFVYYYKDAVTESAVLPLVELLNNEWSLTTYCCGGHWDPKPRFQYPFVSFRVFAHRSAWQGIVKNTWRALEPELGGKLTINVEDNYSPPELWPTRSCWRFCPKIDGTHSWEESRDIFKSGKAFRRELDSLIEKTCSALKVEIDRKKKR